MLTVTNQQTLSLALAAVRDGGTILLYGVKPGFAAQVELWEVWRREINLTSSYSATPDLMPRAMALLGRDDYALERTVSHRLSLPEGPEGFSLVVGGQASKVVIVQ